MNPRLSTKILRPDFQGEFTASILAAAASPDLISFAGGLPNPVSFPVEAMDKATHKVLEKNGVMRCSTAARRAICRCASGSPSAMRRWASTV